MTDPCPNPDHNARLNAQLDEFLEIIRPDDSVEYIVQVISKTNATHPNPVEGLHSFYWIAAAAFRRLADEKRPPAILRERYPDGGR